MIHLIVSTVLITTVVTISKKTVDKVGTFYNEQLDVWRAEVNLRKCAESEAAKRNLKDASRHIEEATFSIAEKLANYIDQKTLGECPPHSHLPITLTTYRQVNPNRPPLWPNWWIKFHQAP